MDAVSRAVRRSKRLRVLAGPKLLALPFDALACIVEHCDFPSWLMLRETCTTLKLVVGAEAERQAFSWMIFGRCWLYKSDDEDWILGGVCFCARKRMYQLVSGKKSFLNQVTEDLSVAVNEIAPDALYDGKAVREVLESSDSDAKGSVLGRFEWSIEYDFASQPSSEDGASLFKDGFSLLSDPHDVHVCRDTLSTQKSSHLTNDIIVLITNIK